ncbi:MAG: glycosyltransferase family 2 protein [Spirochaetota bacterium]
MNSKKFYIYIPCYNEEDNIIPLLENILELRNCSVNIGVDVHAIVVDDKSKDNTAERAQSFIKTHKFVTMIKHNPNKGLVGVLETTFSDAQKYADNKDILGIGLLDGDNSHNPLTFFPMFSKLREGYDVVVASRYQTGSLIMGVSKFRQMLSYGMAILFRMFGRINNIRDYSCGFRAYSSRIVKRVGPVQLTARSFACMVELLTVCAKHGATFFEVPFCLRYDFKGGESKMPFKKTIIETIKVLIKK